MATGIVVYSLAVTTSNSSQAISPSAYMVKIRNDGSATCYINLNAAATTSMMELKADEEIELGLNTISTVQAITSSGTTTLTILAVDAW